MENLGMSVLPFLSEPLGQFLPGLCADMLTLPWGRTSALRVSQKLQQLKHLKSFRQDDTCPLTYASKSIKAASSLPREQPGLFVRLVRLY